MQLKGDIDTTGLGLSRIAHIDQRKKVKKWQQKLASLDEGINLYVYERYKLGLNYSEISKILNDDPHALKLNFNRKYTIKDVAGIIKKIEKPLEKYDMDALKNLRMKVWNKVYTSLTAMESHAWKTGNMKAVSRANEQLREMLGLDLKTKNFGGEDNEQNSANGKIPHSLARRDEELSKLIDEYAKRSGFATIEGTAEVVASTETEDGVLQRS